MTARRLITFLIVLGVSSAGLAPLTAQERPRAERVSVDLHKTPLLDVVRFYANMTGERFIIAGDLDPSMTITVYAPNPVTPKEARQLLGIALASYGLTLERSGGFWKLLRAADAGAGEVIGPQGAAPAGAPSVTLRYADAEAVADVLRRIAAPSTRIITWAPTNALLIFAAPPEVARLTELAGSLDQPGEPAGLRVVPLRHADAEALGGVLQQLVP